MKKQGGQHDDREIFAIVQNEEKTVMNKKLLSSWDIILFTTSNFFPYFEAFYLIHDSLTWMEGKQMHWNLTWH